MKVSYYCQGSMVTKTIQKVEVKMTTEQEEKMLRKFNKEVRVLEWVGGCTYNITHKGLRLKSSSLDELENMYKAAYNGLPVPVRQCSLIPNKDQNYKPR